VRERERERERERKKIGKETSMGVGSERTERRKR
jgi:hypothetical protein